MKFLNLSINRVLKRGELRNKFLRYHSNAAWIKPEGNDTGIVVYNCIAKEKVPLILKDNLASWYSCGPTVYDSAHIGHASCYVKLDIIQRILMNYFKINLITSMGVTDIDDKIINKSHKLSKSPEEISREYELEFWKNLTDLGVMMPHIITRVTDHIGTIKSFIQGIMDKQICYIGGDKSVYFDTHVYKHYGKLQPPQHYEEELDSFAKKSLADFALWKSHKPNEPYWESPWGNGRPGWHIECSAMASRLFGDNLDFHAGGIDLQFPHHENEEAQSCAYHSNKQWVNYWLHPGYLHIKGDVKMSKSLNNTISIDDLLKSHNAATFRMACLLSNYRHHMEYGEDMMKNSKAVLSKIKHFVENCNNYMNSNSCKISIDENVLMTEFEKTKNIIDSCLRDDFDTAKAVNQILNLTHIGNKMLGKTQENTTELKPYVIGPISLYIQNIFSHCFGINLDKHKIDNSRDILPDVIDLLINFRRSVRNDSLESKNVGLLKECDEVRDILKKYNVKVNDGKGQKTSWVFTE